MASTVAPTAAAKVWRSESELSPSERQVERAAAFDRALVGRAGLKARDIVQEILAAFQKAQPSGGLQDEGDLQVRGGEGIVDQVVAALQQVGDIVQLQRDLLLGVAAEGLALNAEGADEEREDHRHAERPFRIMHHLQIMAVMRGGAV